jgi:predicted NUDIX family NTP pyrophosphohydrolase
VRKIPLASGAMPKRSCGILLYRRVGGRTQVLLTHPGGPFWQHRDVGAWTIPTGEPDADEPDETCARREFREELGTDIVAPLMPLGEITQKGGKRVTAFAVEGDFDGDAVTSNTFEMEWPPRSGRMQSYPEVDRAEWMTVASAREKLLPAQIELLDRLIEILDRP